MFGYIHPYPDGNGRMARFLIDAILASVGYHWTVIEGGDRTAYLSALDRASIDMNIQPFAKFIATSLARSVTEIDCQGLCVLDDAADYHQEFKI